MLQTLISWLKYDLLICLLSLMEDNNPSQMQCLSCHINFLFFFPGLICFVTSMLFSREKVWSFNENLSRNITLWLECFQLICSHNWSWVSIAWLQRVTKQEQLSWHAHQFLGYDSGYVLHMYYLLVLKSPYTDFVKLGQTSWITPLETRIMWHVNTLSIPSLPYLQVHYQLKLSSQVQQKTWWETM